MNDWWYSCFNSVQRFQFQFGAQWLWQQSSEVRSSGTNAAQSKCFLLHKFILIGLREGDGLILGPVRSLQVRTTSPRCRQEWQWWSGAAEEGWHQHHTSAPSRCHLQNATSSTSVSQPLPRIFSSPEDRQHFPRVLSEPKVFDAKQAHRCGPEWCFNFCLFDTTLENDVSTALACFWRVGTKKVQPGNPVSGLSPVYIQRFVEIIVLFQSGNLAQSWDWTLIRCSSLEKECIRSPWSAVLWMRKVTLHAGKLHNRTRQQAFFCSLFPSCPVWKLLRALCNTLNVLWRPIFCVEGDTYTSGFLSLNGLAAVTFGSQKTLSLMPRKGKSCSLPHTPDRNVFFCGDQICEQYYFEEQINCGRKIKNLPVNVPYSIQKWTQNGVYTCSSPSFAAAKRRAQSAGKKLM